MNKEVEWLLNEKYQGQKTAEFFSDCVRLETGEPLAYIIGHIPFLDCKIYLDSRPLIPRTETEFWVKTCLTYIRETKKNHSPQAEAINLLDLCAGSGCIGVALAKALPFSLVDFVEIESTHKATILKNCLENGLSNNRFTAITGDLFTGLETGKRYNYILANPPYIDPHLDRAEASVKTFEPKSALYGGAAGMELITTIIQKAPDHLALGGEVWLEHEPEQVEAIARLAAAKFLALHHQDQYGVDRFTQLVLQ